MKKPMVKKTAKKGSKDKKKMDKVSFMDMIKKGKKKGKY